MRSYGVISLLALATISSASPISRARRDSSLIPTPPPACVALYSSNSTAVSDGSAVSNITSGTDTSSISNVTDAANTTTTCLVSPSDLPSLMEGMNSTDFSNLTSSFNCTNNSTSLSDPTNSTDISPPNNSGSTDSTSSLPPDASTTTSDSSATDSSNSGSTDSTSSLASDASTTTSDSSATDSSAPPDSTSPPPPPPPPSASSSQDAGNDGSSGVPASAGQFTADTSDPEGRRKKRSLLGRPILRHHRRIVQSDLPALAQQWQDLCLASGGDIFTNDPCVNLAGVDGINALLSTGGVCDQQDNADNMIDFANSPGITNQADLIAAAIAYRKHPRNADDIGDGVIPSTPYCTKPPRNQELVGIVNDQLPGVHPGLFGGPNDPIVAFGEDGTCPLGQTPDVSTCSCI